MSVIIYPLNAPVSMSSGNPTAIIPGFINLTYSAMQNAWISSQEAVATPWTAYLNAVLAGTDTSQAITDTTNALQNQIFQNYYEAVFLGFIQDQAGNIIVGVTSYYGVPVPPSPQFNAETVLAFAGNAVTNQVGNVFQNRFGADTFATYFTAPLSSYDSASGTLPSHVLCICAVDFEPR